MNEEDALNILQKRNNSLKSQLIHKQLKYGNYSFEYVNKFLENILNEYKKHKSLFIVAFKLGLDEKIIFDCYIQGQMGNPKFKWFYRAINEINNIPDNNRPQIDVNESEDIIEIKDFDGEYVISEYGDGWSYKTYVEGKKIFLISNELETLKQKVKDKHLPID